MQQRPPWWWLEREPQEPEPQFAELQRLEQEQWSRLLELVAGVGEEQGEKNG